MDGVLLAGDGYFPRVCSSYGWERYDFSFGFAGSLTHTHTHTHRAPANLITLGICNRIF